MNNKIRRFLSIPPFAIALVVVLPALPVLASQQPGELLQHSQAQFTQLLPDQPPQSPSQSEQAPEEQPDQSQAQAQPNSQNGAQTKTEVVNQSGTSNDRLFWTLPNFLTVENAVHVAPLTSKGKFKVVLRTSFDFVEYPYIGFLAGISQAENSEPGYGQGAAGYWKRYGASFADNTDENFWTSAILPSLFHQDPRYYQSGTGGFLRRIGYAVSRQFITRSDSGHREFNFSEIAGSAISAGISNIYHPAGDRTFGNTMSVWWTQVGWDTVANVVKEFWPDIRRKVSRHETTSTDPP